jgi:hypothetical protein
MRCLLRAFALLTALLLACNGSIDMSSSNIPLYCFGDADLGSIVCVPESEVWTCETLPNADEKQRCVHTPDGTGGWTCVEQDGNVVCKTDNPAAGGGGGWDCVSTETDTTCISVGEGGADTFAPPGSGSWECETREFGVECTGYGGGDDVGTLDDEGGEGPGAKLPGDSDLPERGDFRTQTPGGWGAPAAGNNPGAYRDAHFAAAFPNGLTIGCSGGHTALFTSAKAIENFLPSGGTPGALGQDYVDPLTTDAGVLAGQVTALTLAAGFDAYDPNFGASGLNLAHLVANEEPCSGMTVQQILDTANNVLGGCPAHLGASEVNGCVDGINNNFVDGDKAGGYLRTP